MSLASAASDTVHRGSELKINTCRKKRVGPNAKESAQPPSSPPRQVPQPRSLIVALLGAALFAPSPSLWPLPSRPASSSRSLHFPLWPQPLYSGFWQSWYRFLLLISGFRFALRYVLGGYFGKFMDKFYTTSTAIYSPRPSWASLPRSPVFGRCSLVSLFEQECLLAIRSKRALFLVTRVGKKRCLWVQYIVGLFPSPRLTKLTWKNPRFYVKINYPVCTFVQLWVGANMDMANQLLRNRYFLCKYTSYLTSTAAAYGQSENGRAMHASTRTNNGPWAKRISRRPLIYTRQPIMPRL